MYQSVSVDSRGKDDWNMSLNKQTLEERSQQRYCCYRANKNLRMASLHYVHQNLVLRIYRERKSTVWMILQNLICVPSWRNWLFLWYILLFVILFYIFYRWCEFPHTPSSILADLVAKTKLHDQILSRLRAIHKRKLIFPGMVQTILSLRNHTIFCQTAWEIVILFFLYWLQPAGRKRSGRTKYQRVPP